MGRERRSSLGSSWSSPPSTCCSFSPRSASMFSAPCCLCNSRAEDDGRYSESRVFSVCRRAHRLLCLGRLPRGFEIGRNSARKATRLTLGSRVVEYPLIFLAGVAGSWHCAGMCGGFACALGSNPRSHMATLARHLTYNVGRVTTYCFLGGLVGFLAAGFCASEPGVPPTSWAQRVLAITSGFLMVFIGLSLVGWLRRSYAPPLLGFGGQALARALAACCAPQGQRCRSRLAFLMDFCPAPW